MSKIRFSTPDWCFLDKSGLAPEDYYRRLNEAGIEAVECVPAQRWTAARNAGLKIINILGPGMEEGLNRLRNHDTLLPQIGELIEQAARNDIDAVIVFSGNSEGQPAEEGIENCTTALRQIAPLAEKAGVGLLFEMLNSIDHSGYQADSASYGFELVRRTGSPALSILYDIYHIARMGDNAAGELLGNLSKVGHIHLAETPGRTRPLPDGNVPCREIITAVTGAGYRGFWGLEFLPGENVFEEIDECFRSLG